MRRRDLRPRPELAGARRRRGAGDEPAGWRRARGLERPATSSSPASGNQDEVGPAAATVVASSTCASRGTGRRRGRLALARPNPRAGEAEPMGWR